MIFHGKCPKTNIAMDTLVLLKGFSCLSVPEDMAVGDLSNNTIGWGGITESTAHLSPPEHFPRTFQILGTLKGLQMPEAIFTFQRWCGLNDRNLYLTVLDVQSPRSMCQLILFLVRAVFLAFFQLPFHLVLTWWGERKGCGVTLSSFMDTNLNRLGPYPYDLIKPQLLLYSK